MSVLRKPYDIVETGSARGTFHLADCLDVFRQLPAHSVDVIVTSPPYNLGIAYNKYKDALSSTDYLEWTNTWVAAAPVSLAAWLTPEMFDVTSCVLAAVI